MKIQSINQNNYQNRNIGFKSTFHAVAHMPCLKTCGGICSNGTKAAKTFTAQRAERQIKEPGGLIPFLREDGIEIFAVDKQTDPKLSSIAEKIRKAEENQTEINLTKAELAEIEKVASTSEPHEIVMTREDLNLTLVELYQSSHAPFRVCEFHALSI